MKKRHIEIVEGGKPRIYIGNRPIGKRKGVSIKVNDEQFLKLIEKPEHLWSVEDGEVVAEEVPVTVPRQFPWPWVLGVLAGSAVTEGVHLLIRTLL